MSTAEPAPVLTEQQMLDEAARVLQQLGWWEYITFGELRFVIMNAQLQLIKIEKTFKPVLTN